MIRLYARKYVFPCAIHRRNFQKCTLKPLGTFLPGQPWHNFSYHLKYQMYFEYMIFVSLYDYNSKEKAWGFHNLCVEDYHRKRSLRSCCGHECRWWVGLEQFYWVNAEIFSESKPHNDSLCVAVSRLGLDRFPKDWSDNFHKRHHLCLSLGQCSTESSSSIHHSHSPSAIPQFPQ